MRYRLSNRQVKELDRGNALDIAVPLPWWDCDVDEYAREVLEVNPSWIRVCRVKTLTVEPTMRASGDPTRNPIGIFGSIVNTEHSGGKSRVTLQVACAVARIHAVDHPRSQYPCQWPGEIIW